MDLLRQKLKALAWSILPLFLFMAGIQIFFHPFSALEVQSFLFSLLSLGLGTLLFYMGIDLGLRPAVRSLGQSLRNSPKGLRLLSTLALSLLIAYTDPAPLLFLHQHAWILALGLAVFTLLGIALLKQKISYILLLWGAYLACLPFLFIRSQKLILFALDASAATIGVVATVLVLAFSFGAQGLNRGRLQGFGLLGMASVGAFFAALLFPLKESLLPSSEALPSAFRDALWVLLPITLAFYAKEGYKRSESLAQLKRLGLGFFYAFLGLFLFLYGLRSSFVPVATKAGLSLAQLPPLAQVSVGFLASFLCLRCEPSILILSERMEERSLGLFKASKIRLALSVLVALGLPLYLALADRAMPFLLLSLFALVFILGVFQAPFVTAMAFDAGAVAVGPLSLSFLLPFVQGLIGSSALGLLALHALLATLALEMVALLFRPQLLRLKEET